jgi:DNA ligase-1
LETAEAGVIEKKHKEWIKKGLEGVIVKKIHSKYVPGRLGFRWVKMKEEVGKDAKLSDTVDCVVMGYYTGRGKRAEFGIGGVLVGIARGEEKIVTVSKVGTGLTDEQFRDLKKRLSGLEVDKKPKEYGNVSKSLLCDRWVKPSLVLEIAADEITKSPSHSSGYALRFPRLVRFRDDKGVGEITSLGELESVK